MTNYMTVNEDEIYELNVRLMEIEMKYQMCGRKFGKD